MTHDEIVEKVRTGQYTVNGLAMALRREAKEIRDEVGLAAIQEGQETFAEQIEREVANIAFDKDVPPKDRLMALRMLGDEYGKFQDKDKGRIADSLEAILTRVHQPKTITVAAS